MGGNGEAIFAWEVELLGLGWVSLGQVGWVVLGEVG